MELRQGIFFRQTNLSGWSHYGIQVKTKLFTDGSYKLFKTFSSLETEYKVNNNDSL